MSLPDVFLNKAPPKTLDELRMALQIGVDQFFAHSKECGVDVMNWDGVVMEFLLVDGTHKRIEKLVTYFVKIENPMKTEGRPQ